jgi:hypothetical protein
VNYADYLTQISTLAVVPTTDSNFLIILPQAINYAQLRMQRDLDFLSTQVYDSTSFTTAAGSNLVTIPTAAFITLQTIQVNNNGVNYPLTPVAKEYIQSVYNSNASAGVPSVFAVYGGDSATTGTTSQYILLGPYPNATYPLTLTGTVHANPLGYLPSIASINAINTQATITFSAPHGLTTGNTVYLGNFSPLTYNGSYICSVVNSSVIQITLGGIYGNPTSIGYAANGNNANFISTYLPDLFIAASMIYIGGYQRNFSTTGADPQMPVNWEQQYQTLLKGATVEEYRKKFQSSAWGSQSPSPIATPPRG